MQIESITFGLCAKARAHALIRELLDSKSVEMGSRPVRFNRNEHHVRHLCL